MFLMPYLKHTVRTAFPVGVALIVAINLLVFFGFQQRDGDRHLRALDYYQSTILIRLEPRAYTDYLAQQGQEKSRVKFQRAEQRKDLEYMLGAMEDDTRFMRALRSGEIIRPDHPDYGQWQQARKYFDKVKDSITVEKYAFRIEHPSLLTAFTHQFLHADIGHLAGNMVVFVLIAPAVETVIGTPLFLAIYLVGGLGAVGLHWLIVGGGGLIGASGAISAAMGAFAALFRWRRIPFFYFVVVYFDIIRAPALLALPIWLANEALQLFWFGDRSVAYGAHIGGLLTGGLLAWPLAGRVAARLSPENSLEPDKGQTDRNRAERAAAQRGHYLARGRQSLREHRFDAAREAYAQVAACPGVDNATLRECFNVAKLSPGSQEFHRVARAILGRRDKTEDTHGLVLDTFREYIALAQPRPFLEADMLAELGERFRSRGCLPELGRVARLLHGLAPEHPRSREMVLAAASGHYESGDTAKAAELTRLVKSPA